MQSVLERLATWHKFQPYQSSFKFAVLDDLRADFQKSWLSFSGLEVASADFCALEG